MLWVELLIRKVGSEHQKGVAIHHRVIAGGEAEKPRHADVEMVVVLDKFLATQRVHDRRSQFAREFNQLLVSSCTTCSSKNRRFLRVIQKSCQSCDFFTGRTHPRPRLRKLHTPPTFNGVSQGHVARYDNDGNTAAR